MDHDDGLRLLKAITTAFDEHDLDSILVQFTPMPPSKDLVGLTPGASASSAQTRFAMPSPPAS